MASLQREMEVWLKYSNEKKNQQIVAGFLLAWDYDMQEIGLFLFTSSPPTFLLSQFRVQSSLGDCVDKEQFYLTYSPAFKCHR